MKILTFRVSATESGCALLEFLARQGQASRSQAKAWLDQRAVFVNQRRIWMARQSLRAGDIVQLNLPAAATPEPITERILYQDADYLVVDKPAGITANGAGSLETLLRQALAMPELRAAHRLDRGTSGCLLFAKRPAAQARLRQLFAQREVGKVYHALVAGRLHKQHFSIRHPIDGQAALTEVTVLDTNRQASHLQIKIPTGRTHQIRKHLTASGHPIVGDPYYATRRALSSWECAIARPLLHAFELRFIQPFSGQALRSRAPLPRDFRQALQRLHLR